jgi:Leucine-rich repeat (LRR) protein
LRIKRASNLTVLSDSIDQLPLVSLEIFWLTSLTSVPASLGNVATLRKLHLKETRTVTLPDTLENLTNLTDLNLTGSTLLVALPAQLFSQMTKLTLLCLDYCRALTELPVSIGNLTKLTLLNLRECKALTTLPASVGNLAALESCDMFGCSALTALPSTFGRLQSLTELNLSECGNLRYIPHTINSDAQVTLNGIPQDIVDTFRRDRQFFPSQLALIAAINRKRRNQPPGQQHPKLPVELDNYTADLRSRAIVSLHFIG